MFACILWIDFEHAKIFKISENGIVVHHKKTKYKYSKHNSNHDLHEKKNRDLFFKELLNEIKSSDELLIFGSGPARNHFKKYIENHSKETLLKIVGLEPMDQLTDNQILEKSRVFFKKYNTYHSDIISYT